MVLQSAPGQLGKLSSFRIRFDAEIPGFEFRTVEPFSQCSSFRIIESGDVLVDLLSAAQVSLSFGIHPTDDWMDDVSESLF